MFVITPVCKTGARTAAHSQRSANESKENLVLLGDNASILLVSLSLDDLVSTSSDSQMDWNKAFCTETR